MLHLLHGAQDIVRHKLDTGRPWSLNSREASDGHRIVILWQPSNTCTGLHNVLASMNLELHLNYSKCKQERFVKPNKKDIS